MKKFISFMLVCAVILTSFGSIFTVHATVETGTAIPNFEKILYSEDFSNETYSNCIQPVTNNVGTVTVENGELKLDKTTGGQWVGARFWLDGNKNSNSWTKTGKYVLDYTIRRDNYNYLIMRMVDAWGATLLDMKWNQNDVEFSGLVSKTVNSSVYGGNGKSLRVTIYYNMDDKVLNICLNGVCALNVAAPDPATASKGGFLYYQIWTEHNVNTYYLDDVSITKDAVETIPQVGKVYYSEDFSGEEYSSMITPVLNGVGEVTSEGGKFKLNKTTSGSWVGTRLWLAGNTSNGWRAKGKYLVDYTISRDDTALVVEDQIRGANGDNFLLMNWKENAVTFSGYASKSVASSVYGGDGKTLRFTAYYDMDALRLVIWLNGQLAWTTALPAFANGKGGLLYHQLYTQAATGVFYVDDVTVGDVYRSMDKFEWDFSQPTNLIAGDGSFVLENNTLSMDNAKVYFTPVLRFLAGSELFTKAMVKVDEGQGLTVSTALGANTQPLAEFNADGNIVVGGEIAGSYTLGAWHEVMAYIDARGAQAVLSVWVDGVVVADGVALEKNHMSTRDTNLIFTGSGYLDDVGVSDSPVIFGRVVFGKVSKSEDTVSVKAIGGDAGTCSATMIAAVYDKNNETAMFETLTEANYSVAFNEDVVLEVSVPDSYDSAKTLKVFLWDVESQIKPLNVSTVFAPEA